MQAFLTKLKGWDVVQLLTQLIGAILDNVNFCKQRRHDWIIYGNVLSVDNSVKAQRLSQVIWLFLSNYKSSESVELPFRERVEVSEVDDISSLVVGHAERSLCLNAVPLLAVNMVQESLAYVHGRSWHPRGPVVLWLIPLFQPLLPLF